MRYTYYNSISGEEGNPQGAGTIPTVTAAALDAIDVILDEDDWWSNPSEDFHFDQVRIYRTTAGGATYYLDRTVNATNIDGAGGNLDDAAAGVRTARITQTDIALTAGGTLMETDNDRPVGMKYIVAHKERIFGVGVSSNPQNLYYSKLNEPENWPTLNFIRTYNPQQGGLTDITGLLTFRDQLYVFTRDQMWVLRGSSETDFILERLPHGIGCVSHHTIKTFQNVVMWWSEGGPVQWDGSSFTFPYNDKLDTLMRWTAANSTDWTNAGSPAAIDPDRMDSMVSEVFKVGGRLMWWTAYTARTGTTNDRILIYDFAHEAWSIMLVPTASMGILEDSTTDMDRIYLGGYTGTIREAWRGFTFEAGAISAQADTKWFDMGQPANRKKLRGMQVWLRARDASLAAHNLTIYWYFDFSTTAFDSTTIAVPASRAAPIYFPLRGKFQHVRFRFENTAASEDFVIDGFDVQFRPQPVLREVAA